ncbi:glycine zipper 2TM domain-containing protein [Lysobacter brunescens]|uniref:Glycine zipper 2TM domain-containing protein n=1 Tax=Lysobacter brunescens TaxID=262323 RepID=A0ABW2YCJ3_9GAMM
MNTPASKTPALNRQLLAVAIGSLLVGGIAVAAYMGNRDTDAPTRAMSDATDAAQQYDDTVDGGRAASDIPEPRLEYAEVTSVVPVTRSEQRYATVIGTAPITETVSSTASREVCEDVVVQERLPERDRNVGGTVAGALIGGLVGNQVGDGNGRKAATAAGAVAGGYIGNRIDRRHEGGQVVDRTERQCRTVSEPTSRTKTVAWEVTYRTPEGATERMRTERKPGERIPVGTDKVVVGYDVTYRYQGEEGWVRLDERPGQRLPVVDGMVMTRAAGDADSRS